MKTKRINRTLLRGQLFFVSRYGRVDKIECRKRDLVIRIADWTRDKDEPAYDVEVYAGGVYDWNESETFCTKNAGRTKAEAKAEAIKFAEGKMRKFLRAK